MYANNRKIIHFNAFTRSLMPPTGFGGNREGIGRGAREASGIRRGKTEGDSYGRAGTEREKGNGKFFLGKKGGNVCKLRSYA